MDSLEGLFSYPKNKPLKIQVDFDWIINEILQRNDKHFEDTTIQDAIDILKELDKESSL